LKKVQYKNEQKEMKFTSERLHYDNPIYKAYFEKLPKQNMADQIPHEFQFVIPSITLMFLVPDDE
ncbi:hypothetical protein K8I31_07540, partial [bacterium]|nr:hypothetical protein [bacterium]